MTRFITLHTTLPNTIAVGVYPTEREAYAAYIDFVQSEFPDLYQDVVQYYEENYPGEDVLDLIIDVDTNDEIQNILSFTVIPYTQEEDFDVEEYHYWKTGSLYRLTKNLLEGKVGDTWPAQY